MRLKSELYKNERNIITSKIINILKLDNDNSIKMYDTVKKEEIDLENQEDSVGIFYIYNDYNYLNLQNLMKDFLYNIFILH